MRNIFIDTHVHNSEKPVYAGMAVQINRNVTDTHPLFNRALIVRFIADIPPLTRTEEYIFFQQVSQIFFSLSINSRADPEFFDHMYRLEQILRDRQLADISFFKRFHFSIPP
jgi:hypothetical protein